MSFLNFNSIKGYFNKINPIENPIKQIESLNIQSDNSLLSDHEVNQLLNSKMDIEIIQGLKYLISLYQKNSSISKFSFKVIQLLTNSNTYINKLCLVLLNFYLINNEKGMLLISNYIDNKLSKDFQNHLLRLTCLSLASTSVYIREISASSIKSIIDSLDDPNPLLRKVSVLSIANHLKDNKNLIEEEDLVKIFSKIIKDPHPLVFSSGIELLISVEYKDYLSVNFHCYFKNIISNLDKLDTYSYQTTIFYLTNFSLSYLCNNNENRDFLSLFINNILQDLSDCYNSKSISILSCLYALLVYEKEYSFSSDQYDKILLSLINTSKSLATEVDNYLFFITLKLFNDYLTLSKFNEYALDKLSIHLLLFKTTFSDNEYILFSKLKLNETLIKLQPSYSFKLIQNLIKYISYPITSIDSNILLLDSLDKIFSYSNTQIQALIIKTFIDLLKHNNEKIVCRTISFLKKIVSLQEYKNLIIVNLMFVYKNITSSIGRKNILWILSSLIEAKPTLILNFFKDLVIKKDLISTSTDVKEEILYFTLRVIYFTCKKIYSEENEKVATQLSEYIIEHFLNDNDILIRNQANLCKYFLHNKEDVLFDSLFNNDLSCNISYQDGSSENSENKSVYYHISNHTNHFLFAYSDEKRFSLNMNEVLKMNPQGKIKENSLSDRYMNVNNEDSNVKNSISNFNQEFKVNVDHLEEYKRKLEEQNAKLFNADDENDEDKEGEIIYD